MIKEIYLAGGCFWGTEQYIQSITGIVHTEVGYANGRTLNPTYEQVCHQNTGHAEVVKVDYEDSLISLPFLLSMYYEVINPIAINRQGGDIGVQYRTGIYYSDEDDCGVILDSIASLSVKYAEPIAIEVLPLQNYSKAEDYHQKYLDKNPMGYCHISSDKIEQAKTAVDGVKQYVKKSKEDLKRELSPIQFEVTQNNKTEPPFQNAYHDHFEKGIYVDITTGEPLFISTDKFESGCGWPAFSKPINKGQISETVDQSHGMLRTEVRSKVGDTHLGHVFEDGPEALGGSRYCINSAALKFVPMDDMIQQGYRNYLPLISEAKVVE